MERLRQKSHHAIDWMFDGIQWCNEIKGRYWYLAAIVFLILWWSREWLGTWVTSMNPSQISIQGVLDSTWFSVALVLFAIICLVIGTIRSGQTKLAGINEIKGMLQDATKLPALLAQKEIQRSRVGELDRRVTQAAEAMGLMNSRIECIRNSDAVFGLTERERLCQAMNELNPKLKSVADQEAQMEPGIYQIGAVPTLPLPQQDKASYLDLAATYSVAAGAYIGRAREYLRHQNQALLSAEGRVNAEITRLTSGV